nr:MAG TPA: hypothetical protein [Caudoviricetes sp.]
MPVFFLPEIYDINFFLTGYFPKHNIAPSIIT